MPRKTTTIRKTTEEAGPKRQRTADVPADVETILDELGENASYVAMWRAAGDDEYLDRVPASEWSLDFMRAKYGGGKYRIKIAGPLNDRNQRPWIKTATFTIAGKPKTPEEVSAAAGTTATPGAPASGMLPPWLKEILVASTPVVVGAIATRLLAEPKADPMLIALLDVFKSRGGESMSGPELVRMIEETRRNSREETREMMADREPKSSHAKGWADVVESALPPLLETFREATRKTTTAPARATARVASETKPATAAAPSATTTGDDVQEPKWIKKVRPYLTIILAWANTGKTPEVKAENVLDDLPPEEAEDFTEHATSENFVADTFRYLPELGATPERREWFTKFLLHMQECVTEPEEEGGGGVAAPEGASPAAPASPVAETSAAG